MERVRGSMPIVGIWSERSQLPELNRAFSARLILRMPISKLRSTTDNARFLTSSRSSKLIYITVGSRLGWSESGSTGTVASKNTASNVVAPTQFLAANGETYAYRRFGSGFGPPLLLLQHFTGTLDNWDPTVTDPLAAGREVILFDSAGVGRSTGKVPETIAGMAAHALAFLDGLGLKKCDVLGFSLGGMVAQQMAQDRPSIFRRMILVGTAPRGRRYHAPRQAEPS